MTPETLRSYNDCDCVPGHRCDCWGYRNAKVERDFGHAAEDIHRAFCEPDHELVGPWDRDMADALRRRGLSIVRTAEVAAARAESDALRAALTEAIAEAYCPTTAGGTEGKWCLNHDTPMVTPAICAMVEGWMAALASALEADRA